MLAGNISEIKYVPLNQCLFYNNHLKNEESLNKSAISKKMHSSGDESYNEQSVNVVNNI